MPFCPSCGENVEPTWTFCGACGGAVSPPTNSPEPGTDLLQKVRSIERIASKAEQDRRNEANAAAFFFVAAGLFLVAMYYHPEWIDKSWAYELSRELHEFME